MPELPDITVYVERLRDVLQGEALRTVRILNAFVLRTAVPPASVLEGRAVVDARNLGKRVVLEFEGSLFLVIHLMIAGRLRWLAPHAKLAGRITLAAFAFDHGQLVLTEAGTKRRASIHVVEGADALAALDPGGIDVFVADLAGFRERLVRENHTLKRALTDPRAFSGIGNAYSDEILWAAKMSPFKSAAMTDAETERLFDALQSTLRGAIGRSDGLAASELKAEKHEGLQVHGRAGEPCPRCGTTIRQVIFHDSSLQYCPVCQTGGKVLADRVLSRLLK